MSRRPPSWAYGVTTVPERRTNLLRRTIRSLSNAGFTCPHLFVDACKFPEDYLEYKLPKTFREPAVRTAGNWHLSLWELYLREPNMDRYAIFQDDFVAYRNLREYLDSCEYPKQGYWNLYTFPENQLLSGDKQGWFHSNQMGRSALALVFDQVTVQMLLGNPLFVTRAKHKRLGHRSIDGQVSIALRKLNVKEYVHNPSLVQHTGVKDTTMDHGKKHPLAESFRGEEFDAKELIACSVQ